VDNSNVVPLRYVDRVLALAQENGIPAQHGVTGGANDAGLAAALFRIRRGKCDTKDLDALRTIVEVLARKW
jgi:hypothetical protein